MKNSIRFVNHASILINKGKKGILCDPWYSSNAFHKGWNLLFENSFEDILEVLNSTSFIWISHEHPDHFSVKFFKDYGEVIRANKIKILFQKTNDKRVVSFLKKSGFEVKELIIDKWQILNNGLRIMCLKEGEYDSALLIDNEGERILNLNDCVIRDYQKANKFFKKTGEVNTLLTQFSYAAWKGGKSNKSWRKSAALEKLLSIKIQAEVFKPKFVIPFASFVYFSNTQNFYLNDCKNTTNKILEYFADTSINIIIMKPGDILGGHLQNINSIKANEFWMDLYAKLNLRTLNDFDIVDLENLEKYFHVYRKRIIKNNNFYLMSLVRIISPYKVFQPVTIFINDIGKTIKFDYLKNYFKITSEKPMIQMRSESLAFIFKNTFGFDTLTVNGCFEEVTSGGFAEATKSMAIENFNNNGINFSIGFLFKFRLILNSIYSLLRVSRKLK